MQTELPQNRIFRRDGMHNLFLYSVRSNILNQHMQQLKETTP